VALRAILDTMDDDDNNNNNNNNNNFSPCRESNPGHPTLA